MIRQISKTPDMKPGVDIHELFNVEGDGEALAVFTVCAVGREVTEASCTRKQ